MSEPTPYIAVNSATREIVAEGRTLGECVTMADATGLWDQAPGTSAPYFFTAKSAAEFWEAWYRSLPTASSEQEQLQ